MSPSLGHLEVASTMPNLIVTLPRPHAAQTLIRREAKRHNVVALGRRSGKSTMGHEIVARTALEHQPAGWFGPTYKLLEECWRELKRLLGPVIINKSEQEHRLEIYGGGTVECWSMDTGDPARGRKYKRIVVDEAAMVPHLMEIWNQALRPTLADLEGESWWLSTPRGLNDFYTLYLRGQDPLETEWASWQMPTTVNPHISRSELDAAKHEMPERDYAQEFEARFLQLEGAGVFRGVTAVARLRPERPERGHSYVIGVDWGRTNDFTAISVLDSTTQEQVALDRFNEIDYELQTERLHQWAEAYRPTLVVAESKQHGQAARRTAPDGLRTPARRAKKGTACMGIRDDERVQGCAGAVSWAGYRTRRHHAVGRRSPDRRAARVRSQGLAFRTAALRGAVRPTRRHGHGLGAGLSWSSTRKRYGRRQSLWFQWGRPATGVKLRSAPLRLDVWIAIVILAIVVALWLVVTIGLTR